MDVLILFLFIIEDTLKFQYYLGLFKRCCQVVYIIFKFILNYILLKMSFRDYKWNYLKETLNKRNKIFNSKRILIIQLINWIKEI